MRFRLIEDGERKEKINELERMKRKHRKKQKGLSPFSYLNPNAGNVEHNVSFFNGTVDSDASLGSSGTGE